MDVFLEASIWMIEEKTIETPLKTLSRQPYHSTTTLIEYPTETFSQLPIPHAKPKKVLFTDQFPLPSRTGLD
jgi:hypothetical protein